MTTLEWAIPIENTSDAFDAVVHIVDEYNSTRPSETLDIVSLKMFNDRLYVTVFTEHGDYHAITEFLIERSPRSELITPYNKPATWNTAKYLWQCTPSGAGPQLPVNTRHRTTISS